MTPRAYPQDDKSAYFFGGPHMLASYETRRDCHPDL